MSRLPRAINSLLRPSQSSIKASALAPPRTPPVLFNYSTRHAEDHPIASRGPYDDARLAAHLSSVFRSLEFPPELARRILTHGSHKAAIHGHNGRLGFIGGCSLIENDFISPVVDIYFHDTNIDRPPRLGIILPIVRPRSCTRPCTPRL